MCITECHCYPPSCSTTNATMQILRAAYDTPDLSGRGYNRIMRMARTVSNLDAPKVIDEQHIAEAIQLCSLDRKYWR